MQRMLVGLVLFLTAAVAGLGAMVYGLKDDLATATRRPGANPSRSAQVDPTASRVETLEERTQRIVRELAELREESARLARAQKRVVRDAKAAAAAAAKHRRPSSDGSGSAPDNNILASAGDRPRDGEGGFVITAEDEDFFLALQKRVDRRRRIDGMTKNLMRRVKMLEDKGDVELIEGKQRDAVEAVLRTYVIASDDMVTRFVRTPDAEHKALEPDERRTRMAQERERFVEDARIELEEVLGAVQAQKVLDRTVSRTYSYRGNRRNR